MKISNQKRLAAFNEAATPITTSSIKSSHPYYGMKDARGWLTRYPYYCNREPLISRSIIEQAQNAGLTLDSYGAWGISPYDGRFEDFSYMEREKLFKLAKTIYHPGEWDNLPRVFEYIKEGEGWNVSNFWLVNKLKDLEEMLLNHLPISNVEEIGMKFWRLKQEDVQQLCWHSPAYSYEINSYEFKDSLGDVYENPFIFEDDYNTFPYSHPMREVITRAWEKNYEKRYKDRGYTTPLNNWYSEHKFKTQIYSEADKCFYSLAYDDSCKLTKVVSTKGWEYWEDEYVIAHKGNYYCAGKRNGIYHKLPSRKIGKFTLVIGNGWKAVTDGERHFSSKEGSVKELVDKMKNVYRRKDGKLCFNDVRNDKSGTYGVCLTGTKNWLAVHMPFLYNLISPYNHWSQVPSNIMETIWELDNPVELLGRYYK